jgi:hypothetical protein
VDQNETGVHRFRDTPAHRRGVFFPTGYTVAVIDDADEARAAARELVEAGVLRTDLHLITGSEALHIHQEERRQASLLDKVISALPTDERSIEEEYLMQADEGSHFLVFRSADATQETRARQALARHGARHIRHYGGWTERDGS